MSFEEAVENTVPNGAYNFTVYNILLDQQSGWKNNSFVSNETIYDYEVSKTKFDLKNLNNEKLELEKLIDRLRDDIEKNIKTQKNPSKQNPIKQTQIDGHIESIFEINNSIDLLEKDLVKYQKLQNIAIKEIKTLRRLINDYKENNNLKYLEKGVHMICSYSDVLRYGKNYIKPIEYINDGSAW